MTRRAGLNAARVRKWYWKDGMSIRQIAARAGIGTRQLREFMIEAGIPRRDSASASREVLAARRTARPAPHVSDADYRLFHDLYDKGLRGAQIDAAAGKYHGWATYLQDKLEREAES